MVVDGNRFVYPGSGFLDALKAQFIFGTPLEDRTDMFTIGASFSF
jgi:hypothetical protein